MLRECSISEENVKLLGRTYSYQSVLWLAHSASGAEFKFHGTQCSIELVGDDIATSVGEEIHYARVAIYVNDKLAIDDLVDEEKKSYEVFKSETAKDVTVRIIKLSESADSTVGIEKVKVVGSPIQKTKDKDRKIEFIGDSITCGYGVESVLGNTYSTSNENAMMAYAYQTAMALEADYSLVSVSGYGVVSGYTGDGVKNGSALLLPYYDKIGMSCGRIASATAPQAIDWDFTKFVPDLIVINLGTNDSSYCGSDVERCHEFQAGYITLLQDVRSNNPKAKIICTLGIMGDSLYPYLVNAVELYKNEAKDDNIVSMKFDPQLEEDGYAVDYHPSVITHNKAADKLTSFVKNLLELGIKEEKQSGDVDTSWIRPNAKLVALTFDDGPVAWSEDSTAMTILRTFKEYEQHATFFYNGMHINEENSKEILFAQELGCEIGNHTWSHLFLTKLSEDEILSEVSRNKDILEYITGQTPYLFRVPYLDYNETVLTTVNAPCINCGVDSKDWNHATKEEIMNNILDAHANGTLENSIVLLHETYETTREAIVEIVPKLLTLGYQLVTVSELAAINGVELMPGQVYGKLERK